MYSDIISLKTIYDQKNKKATPKYFCGMIFDLNVGFFIMLTKSVKSEICYDVPTLKKNAPPHGRNLKSFYYHILVRIHFNFKNYFLNGKIDKLIYCLINHKVKICYMNMI